MKKFIFALLASATICSAQTYQESGGLVIMETENTPSALGLWQKKTSISGHSGSGYLDFTGNNYESGPATSPISSAATAHGARPRTPPCELTVRRLGISLPPSRGLLIDPN